MKITYKKIIQLIAKAILFGTTFIVVIFIAIVVLYLYYGPFPIPIDIYEDLGDGYIYHEEHGYISGKAEINPKILQYTYNDNYIIASQDLRGDILPYVGNEIPPDSIDTDKDKIVYWIVNKKANEKIGCGTENEFVKKCDSIGIADKLVAKIIN